MHCEKEYYRIDIYLYYLPKVDIGEGDLLSELGLTLTLFAGVFSSQVLHKYL